MDLLSEVGNKLFASVKVNDIACIIMLPSSHPSTVVTLWFCVLVVMTMMSLVIYEATKQSFMMRCLYGQKSVCCGSVV